MAEHQGYAEDIFRTNSIPEYGCQKAAEILEQHRNQNGISLRNALQTVETEIRLSRGKEIQALQAVRDILAQDAHAAKKVHIIAEKYGPCGRNTTCRLQVLILYQLANELHQDEDHNAEDKLKWIKKLVADIRLQAYDLGSEPYPSSKSAAVEYGAKTAEKLLQVLREITDDSEYQNEELTVQCHYSIGDIYFRCGEYTTALQFLRDAVDLSQGINYEDDKNYEQLFVLRWTLGNCHYRLKHFVEAEECYKAAIKLIQCFPSIAERWLVILKEDWHKALDKLGEEIVSFETRLNTRNIPEDQEDLHRKITEHQNKSTLESALIVAECRMRLCEENIECSFERVRDMALHESMRTSAHLQRRSERYDSRCASQRVSALVLLEISFRMFPQGARCIHQVAKRITEIAVDVFLISYELAAESKASSQIIAVSHGVALLHDLMQWLRSFGFPHSELRQITEADCIYYIANIYFRLGRYDDSSIHFENAVEIFDSIAGRRQNEHFCLSLWNLDNCYYRLREFLTAENWYAEAIRVIESSENHIKGEWLKIATKDMGKAHRRSQSGI